MPKIRNSIEINRPLHQVFEFLTTPENMPMVMPSLVEVSNAKRNADGSHSFDWVYKMAGVRFHGHGQTVETQMDRLSVFKNDKGIPSTFRWSFQGRDDSTTVELEVDYEIPGVLGKLAQPLLKKLNEREAEHSLANAKTHLEEAAGARPEMQPSV